MPRKKVLRFVVNMKTTELIRNVIMASHALDHCRNIGPRKGNKEKDTRKGQQRKVKKGEIKEGLQTFTVVSQDC